MVSIDDYEPIPEESDPRSHPAVKVGLWRTKLKQPDPTPPAGPEPVVTDADAREAREEYHRAFVGSQVTHGASDVAETAGFRAVLAFAARKHAGMCREKRDEGFGLRPSRDYVAGRNDACRDLAARILGETP